MGVNLDQPSRWKDDIAKSVAQYNEWFLKFAPEAYQRERVARAKEVELTLQRTNNFRNISPELLAEHPDVIATLRMSTAPPIARDRLIGLARLKNPSLAKKMEAGKLIRLPKAVLMDELRKITALITQLRDKDVFPWLDSAHDPTEKELHRAATIVADRLCGSCADPIIRNEQEKRQLVKIEKWLRERGYEQAPKGCTLETLPAGTFAFRFNVPGKKDSGKTVNIPIDAVVMAKSAKPGELPLMIEAKSAGDFANTNKRRKEESDKLHNLRRALGPRVPYILFLCGYFGSEYLGYEAAEGIDWCWEHRIDDLKNFGI